MSLIGLTHGCAKEKTDIPVAGDAPNSSSFLARPSGPITFLSTQLNPVDEANKMRSVILRDFPGQVDFRPNDNDYLLGQIRSILAADPSRRVVVGALHGDLRKLREDGALSALPESLSPPDGGAFLGDLLETGKVGTDRQYYVPWMQASFVFAINKKAIAYLPEGVDLRALTYYDLFEWAKVIHEKTGMLPIGFPAGERGLMHRFLQGPSIPRLPVGPFRAFALPKPLLCGRT
jgi:multiple sugar transport system substrate-binding protein